MPRTPPNSMQTAADRPFAASSPPARGRKRTPIISGGAVSMSGAASNTKRAQSARGTKNDRSSPSMCTDSPVIATRPLRTEYMRPHTHECA
eukprot:scaffold21693_cov129-Isochrysis_galbana.AAC.1